MVRRKRKKYLDFQFGENARKKILKEMFGIKTTSRETEDCWGE